MSLFDAIAGSGPVRSRAFRANYSCEVRHDGQNVRLKKNRHGTEGRTVNVRAGGNGFPHLGANDHDYAHSVLLNGFGGGLSSTDAREPNVKPPW
jgi:hypothetical protein